MKLLVVHPFAAVPVRQEFYSHVQSMTGWEITIVTPARWKTEFGEKLRARRSPHYRGSLLPLPIALPGQIPLHTFVGRITPIIRRERPDVIYVYHEAYGTATFQAFLASIRAGGPPIGFYSSQNIAKRYPWPFAASERFVYRHASFAIVPAWGAADVLRRKGYGQRIEEIPFEIDFDRFHTQGLSALERAELRSGDDVLTVGYVGRLVPGKGRRHAPGRIGCASAWQVPGDDSRDRSSGGRPAQSRERARNRGPSVLARLCALRRDPDGIPPVRRSGACPRGRCHAGRSSLAAL